MKAKGLEAVRWGSRGRGRYKYEGSGVLEEVGGGRWEVKEKIKYFTSANRRLFCANEMHICTIGALEFLRMTRLDTPSSMNIEQFSNDRCR